jgi:hypothetical protein
VAAILAQTGSKGKRLADQKLKKENKLRWQRPTLAGTYVPTTIGAGGLNYQVRDGTGCTSSARATNRA